MRNVTSTITLLAKKTRAEGRAMAPIPLEKIDELAEYLKRVDRLVLAAETFVACVGEATENTPWTDAESEGLEYLLGALREVQS